MSLRVLAVVCAAAVSVVSCGTPPPAEAPVRLRVALFNVRELSTAKIADVDDRGIGRDPQLVAAATVIRRVRPDVLVLNEIDHDYDDPEAGLQGNALRFARAYLAAGPDALALPHAWAGPNNTGILSGVDLDGDGHVATAADRGERRHGDDAFGYGEYPGQYSMAVLSRFPLAGDRARSFHRMLWRDLDGHHIPQGFYSDEALAVMRLSSKSHQDLPVVVEGRDLHLLMSHPTPPVFDGDEDRNGRRNFDEIMFWARYLDGDARLVDDQEVAGGYRGDAPFVVLGDLNARPAGDTPRYDGRTAISWLLEHPRIQDPGRFAVSPGAPRDNPQATTAFDDRGARVDYVLPSRDLELVDGGVYWPAADDDAEGAALVQLASDHRLVWIDVLLR